METAIAEVESPQETTEETSIENASTEDIRSALGITPETAEPATENKFSSLRIISQSRKPKPKPRSRRNQKRKNSQKDESVQETS
jgi:hypothetical protein